MPKFTFVVTVQNYCSVDMKWDVRRALFTCDATDSNTAFKRCARRLLGLRSKVKALADAEFSESEISSVEFNTWAEEELANLKTFTNPMLLAKHLAQMESL